MSVVRALSVVLLLSACGPTEGGGEIEPQAFSPKAGIWRWDVMGDFVDSCGLSEQPIDYNLTLITTGPDGMHLSTHGGKSRVCTVGGSDFGCEDAERSLLPTPATTFEAVDGAFMSETEGSMAYRLACECEGPNCEAIAAQRGIEFPCESTGLAQGHYVPWVDSADLGCDVEAELFATASTGPAVLQLENLCDEALQVHRLDAQGQRVLETTMASGQGPELLWTVTGQPWVVTNRAGECVSLHRATENPGMVTFC